MFLGRRQSLTLAIAALMRGAGLVLLRVRLGCVDPEAVRRRAAALGERHGLRIEDGSPETFFVPPYTQSDAVLLGGQAIAAELNALPRALDAIEVALALYPPGFVRTLCKGIFICGDLSLDGARAGGTFGPAWLILVAAERLGDECIFETCRIGVHHELSSLIWRQQPELAVRWGHVLPSGWSSARDTAEALAAARNEPEERDDGFLSAYGATTVENDFNVYAETAFDAPARLLAAADRSPLVATKAASWKRTAVSTRASRMSSHTWACAVCSTRDTTARLSKARFGLHSCRRASWWRRDVAAAHLPAAQAAQSLHRPPPS